MPRRVKQPRYCKNDDNKETYAKGLCYACYMADYRRKNASPAPPEEPEADAEMPVEPLRQADVDSMVSRLAATGGVALVDDWILEDDEGDTDAVKDIKRWLRKEAYNERREIVRSFLMMGLDKRKIVIEFMRDPRLRKRFVDPCKNIDIMFENDIKKIGEITPAMVYTENLELSLRQHNMLLQEPALSAKDRNACVKELREINRQLGIMKGVIHTVPGKGDMPTGRKGRMDDEAFDEDEDDEEYGPSYKLPVVRSDTDKNTWETKDADSEDSATQPDPD